MTDFNKDKRTNLNQPRVALVKENGGVDKLFYIKFKIYEFVSTSYLNGMAGNLISEDIPVKTTIQDIETDETLKRAYSDIDDNIILTNILIIDYGYLEKLVSHLTVTPDSLDLIEDGRLVTKFTLTGLKRKDSDQRDFVGEIACYLNKDNQPILYKVDRSNPDHPTVQYLSGSSINDIPKITKYLENHEVEKRVKSVVIINEHL